MPNTREKLIDLFMDELPEEHPWKGNVKGLIDMLIANGVTITTDNNVGDKTSPAAYKLSPTEWIPVTERLPEEGKAVLVCLSSKLCVVAWVYDGNWYVSWGNSRCSIVTHWMPLPEPPKGE